MIKFLDSLYGLVELPSWVMPFIRLPEFIRLRGVRLSNVDSMYFKDFAGATRWEHGIAVAALAHRCGTRRGLGEKERVQLTLAGLLHDVGTPPFAHTPESVLANFDHEIEGQRLLEGRVGNDFAPDAPVFQSQLPQFRSACERLSRELRLFVDPDEVAKYTSGEGELGFLINGPIDLDNADNVTRSCLFLGFKVSPQTPLRVADWLATQKSVVNDLETVEDEGVREWLSYRGQLYTAFFEADEGELGRMGFLQHLMRRALDAGIERSQFIWSTDEELMNLIGQLDDVAADDFRPALKDLVQRYRLLESPTRVARVDIEDEATLRILRHPDAVAWITRRLRSNGFEPIVLIMSRRFSSGRRRTLFPEPAGTFFLFHLGPQRSSRALESHLQREANEHDFSPGTGYRVSSVLPQLIQVWCAGKPWNVIDKTRKRNVISALNSVGDWGFRLSRNDGFHAYPSTFVHALPANLLVSLGLKEELILDPFGGTAQTAIEAVKYGNSCVTADLNSIACLVARARLTYLPPTARDRIRSLSTDAILAARRADPPQLELLNQWFHPRTTRELSHIKGFVQGLKEPVLQTFLRACLSAILPACTARRGEQHGYFADNCPLPSDVTRPPYQPAAAFFLEKTLQALSRTERLYGFIERQGRNPQNELARAVVRQVDVMNATSQSYGLRDGDVGAIITSPPYLCMADYALGLRLSYEWLSEGSLKADFDSEIGARRLRTKKPCEVVDKYFRGLESFAKLSASLIRKGGFLAVVLGQPVAKQYRRIGVFSHLNDALKVSGLEPLWNIERKIHWHRNYGYARLKKERVSVYVRV